MVRGVVRRTLIAEHRPARSGSPAKQFKAGTGADLLDDAANVLRFFAMAIALRLKPTSLGCIEERTIASDSKQQKLVSDSPVVPKSNLRFDPDKAAFVAKPPCFEHFTSVKQEGVGSPEMQMGIWRREFGNRQLANLFQGQGAIVIVRRASGGLIVVLPGWVGIDASESWLMISQLC